MAIDDKKRARVEGNPLSGKVKFEIYGQVLIEKMVVANGNSGRIYLPPEWIGTRVKVIKC